ncbi:type IV pilus assembly protein PilC [Plasticicumulans lactativorans]|uniref:Type IV pilus assembly protein PilC n=1 Tax=Plasticicumulans lactativorans TaxID=1133106 RepID=A0A4R2L7R3_9GAMM|nr:type II secretion system F family protein [Plasticicumulans lactativorans]TCO80189.1 type IV pilus assembly protein PilC [Plasticicumulans lactativorans]
MARPATRITAKKAPDDLTFVWEGTDKRGRRVKGELRGLNEGAVRNDLRRQGITPLKLRKKSKPLLGGGGSITSRDMMLFTRQLCTMLGAGVPVVQSLDLVGNGSRNPKLREMVLAIKNDVESGTGLAVSLAKFPLYFDDLYVNLVQAGEEAGVLETLLNKIAIYQEKTETLKAKIKKALFYPAIVMLVAVLVTVFILLFVIPQFESLFRGFGADLPAFTKLVIEISRFMQDWWWLLLGSVAGVIGSLLYTYKRSRPMQKSIDRIALQVPIIGSVVRLGANARFARTLSTMFGSGVPLIEAMRSVAGATGNVVFEEAVMDMREAVATGQQLNFAMRQSTLFPDMVVQMVAIGEESGSLSDMLAKVADFYEEELDNTVSKLTTLIEPLVMAILAVIVGSLVIAMYLPIFKLGSVV